MSLDSQTDLGSTVGRGGAKQNIEEAMLISGSIMNYLTYLGLQFQ